MGVLRRSRWEGVRRSHWEGVHRSRSEGVHRSHEGVHSWLLKNEKKIFEGLLQVNTGWG